MVVPLRKVTLAGAVASIAMLAAAPSASACSCAPLTADSIQRGEAAIVAKLISVEPHGDPAFGVVDADFNYKVIEVLKGEKRVRRDVIAVRSLAGDAAGAACGLPDTIGKRYGLVISRRQQRWNGNSCSTTGPRRLRDIVENGRGKTGCDRNG